MIRRLEDLRLTVRHEAKGGKGDFINRHLLSEGEMRGKGRLYALCSLAPGDSVGWHVHTGEMEICHFISGHGTVEEAAGRTAVGPGDTNITPDGQGHAVINTGREELIYTALILYWA